MRQGLRVLMWFTAVLMSTLCVATTARTQCDCPLQGDMSNDGIVDAVDDGYLINHLFFAGPEIYQDPTCPTTRGDMNADGIHDLVDLAIFWDRLLVAVQPADPCACGFPCAKQTGSGSASLLVESKTVLPSTQGNRIGIYLTNSTAIEGMVVPLLIRALDAYPVEMDMRSRPDGRIGQELKINSYAEIRHFHDVMDGDCAGGPGTGFHELQEFGPFTATSPDAFLYTILNIPLPENSLLPGSDIIPSLEIAFDAPDTMGMFEIDTTCTTPDNHLAFYEAAGDGEIVPSFTKGIITIGCACPYRCDFDENNTLDAVDLNAAVNVLYFNAANPQDSGCPARRADFNANGASDSVDLNALIQHLFFNGPPPVDPCTLL